jgi:maleamate amidohydrolase
MEKDLLENYKRAYGVRVGFGRRPALLLVDFVKGYFDTACELYAEVEDCLASALRIRGAARAAGIPIIFTRMELHAHFGDSGWFHEKVLPLRHFYTGNPMGELADGIDLQPDELLVGKQYPSAFFGTSIASTLTYRGVDSVLLAGVTTSGCIRASCVDAMSHGFRTIVVADACGDRHPSPHEANLFDMNAKYADVVSEDEVIAYLASLRGKQAIIDNEATTAARGRAGD